jgi:hypothetical protein
MMEEHIRLHSAPSSDYQVLNSLRLADQELLIDDRRNLKEISSTFATADSVHPTSRDAFVGGYRHQFPGASIIAPVAIEEKIRGLVENYLKKKNLCKNCIYHTSRVYC